MSVTECGSVAEYSRVYFRLGTDLPKTRPLQFVLLVAACTIAAASPVIVGKTLSTASPAGAVEVEASLGSSSNFVTSALPVADGPLLLPNEETNSETLEKDQARLDAAFDALVEQQATTDALVARPARTDDSIQDHSLDPTPRKQNFSLLAYYVFSEIPTDEKPADTVLKTMKDWNAC